MEAVRSGPAWRVWTITAGVLGGFVALAAALLAYQSNWYAEVAAFNSDRARCLDQVSEYQDDLDTFLATYADPSEPDSSETAFIVGDLNFLWAECDEFVTPDLRDKVLARIEVTLVSWAFKHETGGWLGAATADSTRDGIRSAIQDVYSSVAAIPDPSFDFRDPRPSPTSTDLSEWV